MFWKKKETVQASEEVKPSAAKVEPQKGEKLPGPRDIAEPVGRYLVVQLKQDPDWVWKLKCVLRPHGDKKDDFDFCVFDVAQLPSKNTQIRDYNTFEQCPELALYKGWFNKKTFEVNIEKKK